MRKYSSKTIEDMTDMRRRGYSYPEISRSLGVPKTTVLRHVRNVKILPQFFERWLDRKRSSETLLKNNLEKARIEAEKKMAKISSKEAALIAAMLYWCEGAKNDFSFINTDPVLVATFLQSLRIAFNLSNDRFKISLRIYEDLNKEECLSFWSKVTGIQLDNKTSINVLNGSKHGKLKHGMCRVRIKKGNLIHKEIFEITKLVNKFTQNAPIV